MGTNFMSAVEKTLDNQYNYSVTENGAVGYRTSGKNLLDMNFQVASLRKASDADIAKMFIKAFNEDKITAMKWLFFARDVRGGLGERRLFRVVMKELAKSEPEYVSPVMDLIPEYGRWDDVISLLDTPLYASALAMIAHQFEQDVSDCYAGKNVSLLGKWIPTENTSNKARRKNATKIRKFLALDSREYRIRVSALRKKLRIVERDMSAKQWENIDYEAVPSRANLIYNNAFLRNDEKRRREYLASLEKGKAKINASTLFPHDIVHKYCNSNGWSATVKKKDAALEALWSNLPNTVNGEENTIVVADGSGSMCCNVGGDVTALSVANALAIYFAERSSGQFKDKYITFSGNPQLVDLGKGSSLHDKIRIALTHSECADTNVHAVFKLILDTAIRNGMSQSDLPKNILIISDMEFDGCAYAGYSAGRGWERLTTRLFDQISDEYRAAGYKMPRLIFWNVNSRTKTIPVRENELGVALVSGFSPNIARMVMSNQTDPYLCLMETLNAERYNPVEERLCSIA